MYFTYKPNQLIARCEPREESEQQRAPFAYTSNTEAHVQVSLPKPLYGKHIDYRLYLHIKLAISTIHTQTLN